MSTTTAQARWPLTSDKHWRELPTDVPIECKNITEPSSNGCIAVNSHNACGLRLLYGWLAIHAGNVRQWHSNTSVDLLFILSQVSLCLHSPLEALHGVVGVGRRGKKGFKHVAESTSPTRRKYVTAYNTHVMK